MSAPTWTQPDPALTDEAAEGALLAPFLYTGPGREDARDGGHGLDRLMGTLRGWLCMITGRNFDIGYADPPCTDGRGLYLPRSLGAPVEPEVDAAIYRAMAMIQAGLLDAGLLSNRSWLQELHRDWVLLSTYHLLCTRYLIRRWGTQWPGTAHDFALAGGSAKGAQLRIGRTAVPTEGIPNPFARLLRSLVTGIDSSPDATIDDALSAVDGIESDEAAPLVLSGTAQTLRLHFRTARLGAPPLPTFAGILRPGWFLGDADADDRSRNAWRAGNKPLRQLLRKLKAQSDGPIVGESPPDSEELWTEFPSGSAPEGNEHLYPEWDASERRWRQDAVRVVELDAPTGPRDAVDQIRARHPAEIAAIRARFAALRVDRRWLHGQQDGSDIDINRLTRALTDIQAGHQPPTDWYRRFERGRRPLAVLTLVDLSGSTRGGVLAEEQKAIVMFAEGLRALGTPHAFFGFSGHGPRDCRFLRIQDWDDSDMDAIDKRMGNLAATGASRLGAHIRHATARLSARRESRRVLLLISDGRPEDIDGYRGPRGEHDTAMAVHEARHAGLFVHCVSLDAADGADVYLSRIFGPHGYVIVQRAEALPNRLPEVFRSLLR